LEAYELTTGFDGVGFTTNQANSYHGDDFRKPPHAWLVPMRPSAPTIVTMRVYLEGGG
jgi:hypothetical protein